ncbi:MAG: S4 domain-containing protein [Rikenellaceae bacterium]
MEKEAKTIRIDKWLWSVRLFKTRALAADACKNNKILINDTLVKPSREVKVGDVVSVKRMPVIFSFKAIFMIKSRVGAKDVPTYMENITPQSELDKLTQNITFHLQRDRGTGRPTKKERRDIDMLMDDFFDDDNDFDYTDE